MTHTERLMKMSVKALKKEISNHNKLLKGYSKMRKSDVVSLIIKNKHLFKHLFPQASPAPPPTPGEAKKALAKKRVRIYRFRVNGKEFKKKNNTWSRIIERPGQTPIRQQPKLWTAEANLMFKKLGATGQLTFSHNIKRIDHAPEGGMFMM